MFNSLFSLIQQQNRSKCETEMLSKMYIIIPCDFGSIAVCYRCFLRQLLGNTLRRDSSCQKTKNNKLVFIKSCNTYLASLSCRFHLLIIRYEYFRKAIERTTSSMGRSCIIGTNTSKWYPQYLLPAITNRYVSSSRTMYLGKTCLVGIITFLQWNFCAPHSCIWW